MNPLTLMRAAAWLGVVAVGWSLNTRWGAEEFLGNGPPATFHKHVVGALLLGLVAALAISVSRARWARGLGAAAAAGAVAVALVVRARAPVTVISGSGWVWLMIGAGAVAAGAVATLALQPVRPERRPRAAGPKSKGRR
jgi:hypothetical protein